MKMYYLVHVWQYDSRTKKSHHIACCPADLETAEKWRLETNKELRENSTPHIVCYYTTDTAYPVIDRTGNKNSLFVCEF